jgi:Flp pilus assembly protein CpaB
MDFAENLLSSRRGMILVGAGAALLAALLLIVYLNRYRASLKGTEATVSVLVAKDLIHKGSPGNIIATNRLFQVESIPKSDIRVGAITDPTSLRGLVATQDIYANQQLTAADFGPVAPGSLQTSLSGTWRAITIPFDPAHGMTAILQPGDHVDVYVALEQQGPGGTQAVLKLLMQNALVLRTPATGSGGGNIVLRANGRQAGALAFAADQGKLWLVLRPASGAKPAAPGLVTIQRLLLGVRPVG